MGLLFISRNICHLNDVKRNRSIKRNVGDSNLLSPDSVSFLFLCLVQDTINFLGQQVLTICLWNRLGIMAVISFF